MNCKECIHENVCKEWQYSISGSYNHPICRKPNHFKRKDKEQVRHGKWTGKGFAYKCSACGNREPESIKEYAERYWHYCPNCGAKNGWGESDG